MAVSIDTVYQKVLMLTNKEQRGYITPQEFNLLADMAQMEIFEQYFYDLNQFSRAPSNSDEYANIPDNLQEKISIFKKFKAGGAVVASGSYIGSGTSLVVLPEMYRLGTVYMKSPVGDIGNSIWVEVQEVEWNELIQASKSPLSAPNYSRPVFTRGPRAVGGAFTVEVMPSATSASLKFDYIARPTTPTWGYVVVNGKAMYDGNNKVDFELHEAEQNELVYKILQLAGVVIKDFNVSKAAAQKEGSITQQEKQ